ncbi:kinase-like domain-containing protein [Mycena vulgaris]|nr:kinase-like domain-containing protein [Mycena vulgaris]
MALEDTDRPAAAALNPNVSPDSRLRNPAPPSAEYLATKLSDNPLGLTNMIPREVLYGSTTEEPTRIWNPRDLDPDETSDQASEYPGTSLHPNKRMERRNASRAPLGLSNMIPRDEDGAHTPLIWNPLRLEPEETQESTGTDPRGPSPLPTTSGPSVDARRPIYNDNAPPGPPIDMHVQFANAPPTQDGHGLGHINNLLASWEHRGRLLSMVMLPDAGGRELSAVELRKNLEDIEAQIGTFLTHILTSRDARHAARHLQQRNAQSFIDAIQDVCFCVAITVILKSLTLHNSQVLDRGTLPNASSRSKARRLMRKMSEAHDQLPSSLFIRGVNDHDEHPTFGGGFGDVYRASYQDKMVALKRIRTFTADSTSHLNRLQFCKEALVWQGLNHPFILPLIGIDRETFHPSFCMVSPWMKYGTALKYLGDRGRGDVDRLLLEIAQGLEYLHSLNIVHGDLRGTNILISDDGNACLSDFGLATTISDADSTAGTLSSSSNHGGSLRWFAPELMDPKSFGCERFSRTPATDVYAYACVCLELYTGSPPFSQFTPEPAAMLRVIAGERPQKPTTMSAELWQLVTDAWAPDFRARPKIHRIVMDFPTPGRLSPVLF